MRSLFVHIFLSVVVMVSLAGCSLGRNLERTQADSTDIARIAVLPFHNISGTRDAGKFVADAFVTELFRSTKFSVLEPGNIRQFLIQEKITVVGEMEIERVKLLGKRLRVDAVIVGTVEEFSEPRGRYSVPVVSVTARMIESGTGRLVWSAINKRRGDDYTIIFDYGMVRSLNMLALKVVEEMISTIR